MRRCTGTNSLENWSYVIICFHQINNLHANHHFDHLNGEDSQCTFEEITQNLFTKGECLTLQARFIIAMT